MARILIVEDNALIASDLDAMVSSAGCVVVGPVDTVADARPLLGKCDAALLDVDVLDGKTFDLAVALKRSGRAFLLVTGSVQRDLPGDLQGAAFLQKPYTGAQIRRWLACVEEAVPTTAGAATTTSDYPYGVTLVPAQSPE